MGKALLAVGAAPGSISGCSLSPRCSSLPQTLGPSLLKSCDWEVVLSSEDCNAFSCLGYVTSYRVIIKYRLSQGWGGGSQLTSSRRVRCAGHGQPETKEMSGGKG